MPHPTDDIIRAMKSPSTEDQQAIQQAYDVAKEAHGVELRKSGDPYIIHPHAIAITLAELGMDRDTIIAGILHDTLEDTALTAEEIEEKFGATVRFFVESVTKLSKLKYHGLERHVESLRRLFVATANDVRVIIIKLADRLHNMQTIEYIEPIEKRLRIALETKEIYVPVAERLGIGVVKAKLEDLAFKTLEPERYSEMERFLKERSETAKDALNKAVNDLRKALAEAGIRKFHTEARLKNVHSFATKLARKENDPDKVYDIFAIRVVVPTVEDCYRALGVIHTIWTPMPGRIKDYIATPKPNGYRTLHTTIITPHKLIMEIQIRSEEMQQESKFGIAAHFLYKNKNQNPEKLTASSWIWKYLPSLMRSRANGSKNPPADSPRWLKELNNAAEEFSTSTAFEQALREDFFAQRMFVFTPKGDVIDLPVGATPIDFAYAVHSNVGNTMIGAKVNGKMRVLGEPLENGDIVEILTKKSAKPNKKWLNFAKTSGAKHHIRNMTNRES